MVAPTLPRGELPRLVHVMNAGGPASIPHELAAATAEAGADVAVVNWYGSGREEGPLPASGRPRLDRELSLDAPRWLAPSAFGRLLRYLRRERPDVVHLHHTASAAAGAVAATVAGVPAVVKTEHRSRRARSAGQSALDAVTLALADAVVGNSDATLASFPAWARRLTRGKRTRIHNGVDVERVRAERGRPPETPLPAGDGPLVTTVGRLIPEKNQGRLLRAVARLSGDGEPAPRLLVVGDGPLRRALEAEAEDLDLGERVRFAGEVARGEVYRLLWASDLFAVVSRTEGFCVAAAEAMAAGLPVVASEIPALREVVGDRGIYCDPGSLASVAEGLRRALSLTDEERDRAGAALSTRARERFTLERAVRQHLELYAQLLEERRVAG